MVVIGKLVDVAVVVTAVVEAADSLLNIVEVVKVTNSFSDEIKESFRKDSSGSKISISSTVTPAGRVIGAFVGKKYHLNWFSLWSSG